jgi:hypothetical protein
MRMLRIFFVKICPSSRLANPSGTRENKAAPLRNLPLPTIDQIFRFECRCTCGAEEQIPLKYAVNSELPVPSNDLVRVGRHNLHSVTAVSELSMLSHWFPVWFHTGVRIVHLGWMIENEP